MADMNNTMVFHSNFFAMGTRMDIVLPFLNNEEGDEVYQSIRLEVKRLEKKLSRFDENGPVYRINKKAPDENISIDNELFDIIQHCNKFYVKSHGYFDITQRKIMNYWKSDQHDEKYLKLLVDKLGMDKIILDGQKKTIRFNNEEVEIDFGGFGKGYALESVKGVLDEHAVKSAFISFGESSVLTVGSHPYGAYWGVGVRNLKGGNKNAYTFKINNASVSTSGITPLKKGSKWGHVINPKNGMPVQGTKTVSVCSSSPVQAEVLSTILLISGQEEANEIINGFLADEVIELNYDNGTEYTVIKLK